MKRILLIVLVIALSISPVLAWDIMVAKTGQNAYGWRYSPLSIDVNSSGYPAISYALRSTLAGGNIEQVYWTGSGWVNESVSGGVVSFGNALKFNNTDSPKVTYTDSMPPYNLHFAERDGAWIPWVIEAANIEGFTSLAINSTGNVSISYFKLGKLKYATQNTGVWSTVIVDPGVNYNEQMSSIALDKSEYPGIAYPAGGDLLINYAHWDGVAWSTTTVYTPADVVSYPSIGFNITGNASISFYEGPAPWDISNSVLDLKYAQFDSTTGLWTDETVDSTGDVGQYSSLVFNSSGVPHISYFDNTTKNLKHAWKTNGIWNTEIVPVFGHDAGYWTSIAVDQYDSLYIAYFDNTSHSINVALELGNIPHLRNAIYGLTIDGSTGLTMSGTNVNRWNITNPAPVTNISFDYLGVFPGVYLYNNLPEGVDYYVNATRAGYLPSSNSLINTGAAGSATRQDLILSPSYDLTLNIKDLFSNALLIGTTVNVVITGITTPFSSTGTTTTGVVTIHSVPFGIITSNVTALGYYPSLTTYTMTGDRNETVYLDSIGTSIRNTWFTQKQVRLKAVDMYGVALKNANITINYIASTLPAGASLQYLVTAFGIDRTIAESMLNSSVAMTGFTGADGSASFMMFSSIGYRVHITDPAIGLDHYVTLYPQDTDYTIYCPLPSQVVGNRTQTQLENSTLFITEPDINHVTFNLQYQDTSGFTTDLVWNITAWDNRTIVYSKRWAGPFTKDIIVVDNVTVANIRGQEWKFEYNSTRSNLA